MLVVMLLVSLVVVWYCFLTQGEQTICEHLSLEDAVLTRRQQASMRSAQTGGVEPCRGKTPVNVVASVNPKTAVIAFVLRGQALSSADAAQHVSDLNDVMDEMLNRAWQGQTPRNRCKTPLCVFEGSAIGFIDA